MPITFQALAAVSTSSALSPFSLKRPRAVDVQLQGKFNPFQVISEETKNFKLEKSDFSERQEADLTGAGRRATTEQENVMWDGSIHDLSLNGGGVGHNRVAVAVYGGGISEVNNSTYFELLINKFCNYILSAKRGIDVDNIVYRSASIECRPEGILKISFNNMELTENCEDVVKCARGRHLSEIIIIVDLIKSQIQTGAHSVNHSDDVAVAYKYLPCPRINSIDAVQMVPMHIIQASEEIGNISIRSIGKHMELDEITNFFYSVQVYDNAIPFLVITKYQPGSKIMTGVVSLVLSVYSGEGEIGEDNNNYLSSAPVFDQDLMGAPDGMFCDLSTPFPEISMCLNVEPRRSETLLEPEVAGGYVHVNQQIRSVADRLLIDQEIVQSQGVAPSLVYKIDNFYDYKTPPNTDGDLNKMSNSLLVSNGNLGIFSTNIDVSSMGEVFFKPLSHTLASQSISQQLPSIQYQANQAIIQLTKGALPGSVDLTLRPEELGQLRFEIAAHGDRLHINLLAERPEAMELFRRHIDQLTTELRETGLKNFSFSFGQWEQRNRQPPQTTDLNMSVELTPPSFAGVQLLGEGRLHLRL